MDAQSIIALLDLNNAPSDTVRAQVLMALHAYGEDVGNTCLVAAALAAMPQAHPFQPPEAWRQFYEEGFRSLADDECGVYIEDMPRYCGEYWQNFTDAQRQERLHSPYLGIEDGKTDAHALNGD